jgi:hypothetical protein
LFQEKLTEMMMMTTTTTTQQRLVAHAFD